MAHEATQSLNLASDKGYITQNKDILTKKIRWDRYLKSGSYLMYSIFIALLSVSILLSGANVLAPWNISIDLISIFIGLTAMLFSIGLISWIYKGTMKKLFVYNYYIMHFINALMLMIIVIVLSLPIFAYKVEYINENPIFDIKDVYIMRETRSLVFGVGFISWSVIGAVGLLVNTFRLKGTFPAVWLKVKLSLIAIFIFPLIAMISWVASNPNQGSIDLFLWIELLIFALGVLYITFIYSYIKSFKELLLSDKTEQEIQKIDIFRNVSFLMILMSSTILVSIGFIKVIPIWPQWGSGTMEITSIISTVIDGIVLIAYLVIIIFAKHNKGKKQLNKLSTIDNLIIMDFFKWFLLVKTIVLISVVATIGESLNLSAYMCLSSNFIAIFIINISTILLGVNFPNIKNTVSTIVTTISSLIILAMVLFQTTINSGAAANIFESSWSVILLMSPAVIASSINLGIKIMSYSKIKKDNDNAQNEDSKLEENKSIKAGR